jgi:lipopolysaccharide export system permease protein
MTAALQLAYPGCIVISARRVDPSQARLLEAVFFFFEFDAERRLRFVRRVSAQQADLRSGFWQLSGIVDALPGQPPTRSEHLAISTRLEPTALLDRYVSPQSLSFYRLPGVIAEAEAAGLTPTRYELRWQSLLATPLLFAAMAALGAVFSLRLSRLGGGAVWAMTGLGAGFLLFFVGQLSNAFATSQVIPPLIAVWAPPLSGLLAAMAILGYLEDG